MLEPIILKVQTSQFSSDNLKTILIYNKDKSILFETNNTEFVGKVMEVMKDQTKAFIKAQLTPNDINVLEVTDNQNW